MASGSERSEPLEPHKNPLALGKRHSKGTPTMRQGEHQDCSSIYPCTESKLSPFPVFSSSIILS